MTSEEHFEDNLKKITNKRLLELSESLPDANEYTLQNQIVVDEIVRRWRMMFLGEEGQ
jgi:hypothetical protein